MTKSMADVASDLDALDAPLEADNIVVSFENPIDPEGDPIDFEMRPMTPGETAVCYGTLLGRTFFEAAGIEAKPT